VPTRTGKVAESVAREIMQDIRRDRLAPGSRLPPEMEMLERFQVGRGSLREALRILEVNGLVTMRTGPRGGPVVAPRDPASFGQIMTLHLQSADTTYRQLLEARVEYEVLLARMAAEQGGDTAAQLVRAATPALSGDSSDEHYGAGTAQFHGAVGRAAGNPVLALVADAIYSIWAVRVTRVLYPPDHRAAVLHQHELIARAIERHDPRRAERLMREHMQEYKQFCEQRYPARMEEYVDWN
jgi:DNA-binding FadR family transcriptional regulator